MVHLVLVCVLRVTTKEKVVDVLRKKSADKILATLMPDDNYSVSQKKHPRHF